MPEFFTQDQVNKLQALDRVNNEAVYGSQFDTIRQVQPAQVAPVTDNFVNQSSAHQVAFDKNKESMGFFERYLETAIDYMSQNDVSSRMADIGNRAQFRDLTEVELAQLRADRKSLEDQTQRTGDHGFFDSLMDSVAAASAGTAHFGEIAANAAAKEALAAGTVGALGGIAGGPATMAAGFGANYVKGLGLGIIGRFGLEAAGRRMANAILDAEHSGKEVTGVERSIAIGEGLLTSALFGLGMKVPAAMVKGVVSKSGGARALQQAINKGAGKVTSKVSQIAGHEATAMALGVGHTTAAIAFYSAGSAVIDETAAAMSKKAQTGSSALDVLSVGWDVLTDEKTWSAASEAAKDSISSGAIMAGSLTGPVVATRIARRELANARANRAINSAASAGHIQALAKLSKDLDIKNQAPDAVEAYVQKVYDRKGKQGQSVYIESGKWEEYFTGKGIDPEVAATGYLKDSSLYTEAIKRGRGHDIEIPASRFVSRMGDSADSAFFLSNGRTEIQSRPAAEIVAKAKEKVRETEKAVNELDPDATIDLRMGLTKESLVKELKIDEKDAEILDKAIKDFEAEQASFNQRFIERRLKEADREIELAISREQVELLKTMDGDLHAVAYTSMLNGKTPSGAKSPLGKFRLNRSELIERYGEEYVTRNIPESIMNKTSKGTVPLQEASVRAGFHSVDTFVDGIVRKGDPRALTREIAGELVRGTSGVNLASEMVLDGWKVLTSKRLNAARNRAQWELLSRMNDRALKKTIKELPRLRRKLDEGAIRAEEMGRLENLTLRDLKKAKLKAVEAQLRESRNSADALSQGNIQDALLSKEAEIRNNVIQELAEAEISAYQNNVKKAKKFTRDWTQKNLGKAGKEYISSANAVLDAMGIKVESPGIKIAEMKEFLDRLELGIEVPEIVNARVPYSKIGEVPASIFNEAVGFIESLAHVAREQGKVIAEGRKIETRRFIDTLARQVTHRYGVEIPKTETGAVLPERVKTAVDETIVSKFKDLGNTIYAKSRIKEFFHRDLDGGVEGGFMQRTMDRPLHQARDNKTAFLKTSSRPFNDAVRKNLTKEEWKNFSSTRDKHTVFVPEIGTRLTLEERIGIALHQGNEHNRIAVRDGRGWTQKQVNGVLRTLEKRHWDTVSGIWKAMDKLYPHVEGVELRTTGRLPERVRPEPVQTQFGTIEGGYFPILYERGTAGKRIDVVALDEMFGSHGFKGMTKRGHAKSRKGVPEGAQARIDFSVISEHLENVAHDVAYRETVINLNRIVNNREFQSVMERVGGVSLRESYKSWVKTIALNRDPMPTTGVGKFFRKIRKGTTVNFMLWNASSITSQLSGIPVAYREIGPRYLSEATMEMFRNTVETGDLTSFHETLKTIYAKAPEMKERISGTFDREVSSMMRDLGRHGEKEFLVNVKGANKEALRSFFYFTGMAQGMIDAVIWKAAYNKAILGDVKGIKAGNDGGAVRFATSAVERSQGTGRVSFLPEMMSSGGELQRMLFLFYTPLAVQLNQTMDAFTSVARQRRLRAVGRGEGPKAKDYAHMTASLVATAFLPSMIYLMTKGQLDEASDIFEAPLEMVPVARDIPGFFKYNQGLETPAFKVTNDALSLGKKMWKMTVDDKPPARRKVRRRKGKRRVSRVRQSDRLTGRDIRKLFNVVGTVFGLPGNAFGKPISLFKEYYDNATRQMGAGEFAYEAIFTGASKSNLKGR